LPFNELGNIALGRHSKLNLLGVGGGCSASPCGGDSWLRILIKIHERNPIVSQCGNHVRKSYSSTHGIVQKTGVECCFSPEWTRKLFSMCLCFAAIAIVSVVLSSNVFLKLLLLMRTRL
jgi:hypothetical protein